MSNIPFYRLIYSLLTAILILTWQGIGVKNQIRNISEDNFLQVADQPSDQPFDSVEQPADSLESMDSTPVTRPLQKRTYRVTSNQIPVQSAIIISSEDGSNILLTGTCHAKHDHPSVSKKKNRNHMDEDCCPDPDEWPNPGCSYSANGFDLMLSGPTPGHVKR